MKKVNIYDKESTDKGYLGNNQNWWFDPTFRDSFEIFSLDAFYPDAYFSEDHVSSETVQNYVTLIKKYFKDISGKDLQSVLELGAASGWFTKKFQDENIVITAFEGTKAGVNRALNRGVKEINISKFDLRRSLQLNRKYDIAICTEVAEHIETPFSSQLVSNLVNHADIVWFSFESPDTNEAHYHHCNEQPEKFWINLFDFYGFLPIKLSIDEISFVGDRGRYVFYNPKFYQPASQEHEQINIKQSEYFSEGNDRKAYKSESPKAFKSFIRSLLPAFVANFFCNKS